MDTSGWTHKPAFKILYSSTIILAIVAYVIITVALLNQPNLPNPLVSNLQIILSIVYFACGVCALANFVRTRRLVFGLLALFCTLPSLHLFTTSGAITKPESVNYWYIYFANISYYFTLYLFSNYLVERLRRNIENLPIESFISALTLALGLLFANYFDFFMDFSYLDSFPFDPIKYYHPLYKADLRIAGAAFIALIVAIFWLYRLLKESKDKKGDSIYLYMWIFAIVITAAEIFSLYIGYRDLQLKVNFPVIMIIFIVINIYLLIVLGFFAFRGLLRIDMWKNNTTQKGKDMHALKNWRRLVNLIINEQFRQLVLFILMIAIALLLLFARLTADNPFLLQTIAFFIAVILFLYGIIFPLFISIRSKAHPPA